MNSLKILQYNVQKSRNKVMSPLFADERITSYDIIAIQEPWQNPFCNTSYCPSAVNFHLVYNNQKQCSCIYINKSLDVNSWDVQFHRPDLCSLHLRTKERDIWIHAIYSQPPGGYTVWDYPSPIPLLPDLLSEEGEHIILGDFNLHSPIWCGARNPTTHEASDKLIEITSSYDLWLASPQGAVTWEAQGSTSTIDLVFASQWILDRIVWCQVQDDMDFGSDHYPITT